MKASRAVSTTANSDAAFRESCESGTDESKQRMRPITPWLALLPPRSRMAVMRASGSASAMPIVSAGGGRDKMRRRTRPPSPTERKAGVPDVGLVNLVSLIDDKAGGEWTRRAHPRRIRARLDPKRRLPPFGSKTASMEDYRPQLRRPSFLHANALAHGRRERASEQNHERNDSICLRDTDRRTHMTHRTA